MPIRITCPSCDESYNVSDELRGKKVKCKSCGGVVTVGGRGRAADDADGVQDRKGRPVPVQAGGRRFRDPEDEADDLDELDETPRRKRKDDDEEKSSKALVFALCGVGAGVLAIGAVILIILMNRGGDTKKDDGRA